MSEAADAVVSLPPSPVTAEVAPGTSLGAFFHGMNATERRTFWVCASAYALDAVDFMVFTLVLGTVIAVWHVERSVAGLVVTGTLVCSAVGGWAAGYISDRFGRVRAVQLTVAWFSVFCLLSAFAQSFAQLAVYRALLGFGFGGEWTAGAVLMGEVIRPRFRGRAVGCVQSGWSVGWGAAVLAQAVLYSVLPAESAWRWMFGVGFVPSVILLVLTRYVSEPPVAAASRAAQGGERRLLDIFSPRMIKTTALAALLSVGAQGGYYAVNTWLPLFLQTERGLSVVTSTGYLASLIAGSFSGYLVGAWLADRIGRRNLFLVFSVAALLLVGAFTQLRLSNHELLFLAFPLGFAVSAYFAGSGAFLSELFPTNVRGSGMGFTYNFGRGIGALFPALVGRLSATIPLSAAIAVFATIAYTLLFVAALLLPETRGKNFTS